MFILYLIVVYLILGAVFALWFLIRLIHKIDEGAEGAPLSFKLIIFPGCVVFWPVLLKKYLAATRTNQHD